MDLRQLEHFVVVAEEKNFTAAAARLHLAASGLSASVRALERELGVTLFDRDTRHVALTEAGQVLLIEARRTLSAALAAQEAVGALQTVQHGRLSIGISQRVSGLGDFPTLLAQFHALHPGVKLRLQTGTTQDLFNRLHPGELDVVFAVVVRGGNESLRLTTLGGDRLVLACSNLHPLAGRSQITLPELATEPLIVLAERRRTRELLLANGVTQEPVAEVDSVAMLLELVVAGMGVGVVPETASSYSSAATYVPISPPIVARRVLATAADRPITPPARAFIEYLRVALATSPNNMEDSVT